MAAKTKAAHTGTMLQFRRDPTLWDVEAAMVEAALLAPDEPIMLRLAHNTDGRILSDIAIARSIATLAARPGPLVIRDYTTSWENARTQERYLETIDGAAALLHVDGTRRHLVSLHEEPVPDRLVERLRARFLTTAKLERDVGPSRTYVAVDPKSSVPIEFDTRTRSGREMFDRQIESALKQFGLPKGGLFKNRNDARTYERSIYDAVYEIFHNTYEHGRVGPDGTPLPGLRFIRFRTHIENDAGQLARRSESFGPLTAYFARRSRQHESRRFFEISIGDEGMGIVAHYLRAIGGDSPEPGYAGLLSRILTESLSSKRFAGSGLGLPIAMMALSKLQAFVTLRSGDEWLYRDFSADDTPGAERSFDVVPTPERVSRVVGTQFTILCDFAIP
jgi:hypothetical protein